MNALNKIGNFAGLFTASGGDGPIEKCSSGVNFRIDNTSLNARFGYRNIATAPANFSGCYGFQMLSGYTGNTYKEEGLVIQSISGTIKPFSFSTTTGVRAEVTTGGVSLSLPTADYVAEVFKDYIYIVGAGATPGVFKKYLGDDKSWATVQDTTYSNPVNPTITVTAIQPKVIKSWNSAVDTLVFTNSNAYAPATITLTYNADGSILLNGPSTDGSATGGYLDIETSYSTTQDFSGADYLYQEIQGQNYLLYFNDCTVKPQLKIAGAWTNVTDAKFVRSTTSNNAYWQMYVRGMTLTAVQGCKIRMQCKPNRAEPAGPKQNIAIILPIYQGGYYLEASSLTKRLWDTVFDGDGITYGVQYYDSVGLTSSNIVQASIDQYQGRGYIAPGKKNADGTFSSGSYGYPSGGIIKIEANAPTAPYDTVRFLRYDYTIPAAPIWKELSSSTTAPFVLQDTKVETEIPALTTRTGSSSVGPTSQFTGDGMTGLFSFFGRMCWLRGTRLEYSTFGDPLSLFSDNAPTPDPADLTQPARFVLADNYADSAVAGIQAGRVGAIILGKKSAYAQLGQYPVSMSAPGQVHGSRGVAGAYAYVGYLTPNGVEGCAYVDPNGKVWFIPYYSITTEKGLGTAHIVDMSLDNPNFVWDWLVSGQFGEFGYTSLSDVRCEFSKLDGSLRIMLGRRQVVLAKIQGKTDPEWIPEEYTMTTTSGTVSSCTDYSSQSAVASSVVNAGTAWTNVNYAFGSDDSYAYSGTIALSATPKTDILRADGFTPPSSIPAGATITSVTFRIERKKTGDLVVTETTVQPRLSLANWGSNITESYALTTSDVVTDFVITTGLPTVAQINSGALGIDLQYTPVTSNTDWNDPAKWTITVSGGGTASTMTVTATYIGAGAVPTSVYVDIFSSAQAGVTGDPGVFNLAVNNGQGTLGNADTVVPGSYALSSTVRTAIPLVAGTGSVLLTRSATSTYVSGVGAYSSTIKTFTGSAALSLYVLPTVYVDNVSFDVCYTVTTAGASSGVAWKAFDFHTPNKLWGIRSTGQIDEIAYDTSLKRWIEGSSNRDGGYSMTTPYWTSTWRRDGSEVSRLSRVYVEKGTANDQTITVSACTDRNLTFNTLAITRDSYKANVSQQGKAHLIKFTFTEGTNSINVADIDLQPISNQFNK